MRAGRLRHHLLFQVKVSEQDSDGATTEAWTDAFVVNPRMPCEVTPLQGRELMAAQAVHTAVTARIRTRFRPGFDAPTMRATDPNGTTYNIEAVVPDATSGIRYVTLLASSGLNAGG